MIDLKELRRLAEAATQGEWKHNSYLSGTESILIRTGPNIIPKETPYEDNHGYIAAHVSCHDIRGFSESEDEIQAEKYNNAAYIAAANPAVMIELLGRMDAAEKVADAAKEFIRRIEEPLFDDDGTMLTGISKKHLRETKQALAAWQQSL